MVNIFEVEANASQDANYREHLNRNWQNGNTEFDKIENWLNALETTFSNFQTQINDLQQQISDLNLIVKTANNRINELAVDVDKLNKAVFYAEYINDTENVADDTSISTSEDINETNVIDDDNGLIIEEDKHKSLPGEVND
ncbi:hypothetical protein ODU72_04780 [Lactobacillus amylovorus]|uniref:Uncharacterized protein n=1 Tax=Lactobacillus amylovorus TaxID=1604 RepID=A0A9X4AAD2_LACAM|nr:hypothetical protein [Lactobacillus amylovorus]MDB6257993.1 hypothetical protein [Lactobacillus amylovorus]